MARRRSRVWFERGFNALTVTVAMLAAYLLVTERVVPALRGTPARTLEGERLRDDLEFRSLSADGADDGATYEVPGTTRTLLLAFSSTCPACFENLPAWKQIIGSGAGSTSALAVALERDLRAASTYVRRHLPSATPVVPRDAARFAAALGVEVVPFTALIASDGTVEFARPGRLGVAGTSALTDLLARRREVAGETRASEGDEGR